MKQQHRWISPWLCTALIAAAIYAASPLRRLPGGDSGELMAEACVNGVAHPPGYPLLLSLLQISEWVVRKVEQVKWLLIRGGYLEFSVQTPFVCIANVVNEGFAVGAAACVTHTVDLWARREFPLEAITAGVMFATSKLTWEYAVGLEVFALNNLLTGVLHVLVIRHFIQPSARNAYVAAFVCGLGLTNQHTIILFEAPFIAAVLLTRHLGLKEILWCAVWFLAGISVYTRTFTVAQTPTPGSWGDASTLSGLWSHVLRQEYGTFRLSPLRSAESEGFLARLQLYLFDTMDEFTYAGVTFASIGGLCAVVSCTAIQMKISETSPESRSRQYGRTLLAAMAMYLTVFHSLANIPLGDPLARAVSSRFSMQPNTLVAIWLGMGMVVCSHWLRHHHSRSKLLVQAFRYGVCCSLVSRQLSSGSRKFSQKHWREDAIRFYGERILSSLPENALLLSYTDINWNTIRYLQLCEGQRRDVVHLSLQLMPFPWFPRRQHALYASQQIQFPVIRSDVSTVRTSNGYAKYLREFLLKNLPAYKDRLFLDLHAVNDGDIGDNGAYHGVALTPHGALWQVHPSTAAGDPDKLYERWGRSSAMHHLQDQPSSALNAVNPRAFATGSWEFAALTIVNDGEYQNGLFRLSHWLGKAKSIATIEQLVAFVHGLHITTQVFEQVVARNATTYPEYDVRKNAAVAHMRFYTGLEVLVSVVNEDNKPASIRKLQSSKLFMELEAQGLLRNVQQVRAVALEVVGGLSSEMHARSDPDLDAFLEFVEKFTDRSILDNGELTSLHQQAPKKQPAGSKRKKRKRRAKANTSKQSRRT